jgi:hypothetical protein
VTPLAEHSATCNNTATKAMNKHSMSYYCIWNLAYCVCACTAVSQHTGSDLKKTKYSWEFVLTTRVFIFYSHKSTCRQTRHTNFRKCLPPTTSTAFSASQIPPTLFNPLLNHFHLLFCFSQH